MMGNWRTAQAHGDGWLLLYPCATDHFYQVFPQHDVEDHVVNKGADCWCEPRVEKRHGKTAVIHSAKDLSH
jgi:hypothetical protein